MLAINMTKGRNKVRERRVDRLCNIKEPLLYFSWENFGSKIQGYFELYVPFIIEKFRKFYLKQGNPFSFDRKEFLRYSQNMSIEEAFMMVSEIFNEIQESKNIQNKSIFSLQEFFEKDNKSFIKALEYGYLSILKFLKDLKSTPKRIIEIFESLTEKLFTSIHKTSKDRGNKKCSEAHFKLILEHFLLYFSQGADSPHFQIRIFCSRHLAIILKIISREEVEVLLSEKTKRVLIEATISLIKEKSALKPLGIKLASFVQHVNGSTIKNHKEALKRELLKAMCSEENKEVRKLAMTNIEMNEENFGDLISRTREIESDLRMMVFRKMIKEKIPLANMKLCDIYKVVYDGLSSRENSIKDECIHYLKKNYYLFDENLEKEKGASKKNLSKKRRKELFKDVRIKIRNFLSVFQIESSLFYPHIYNILETLVQEFLISILNTDTLCFYLREIFEDLSTILKESAANPIKIDDEDEEPVYIEADELFLIRILIKLSEERNSKRDADKDESELYSGLTEAFSILIDVFPGGVDFCKLIENFHKKSSCLGLYQSLLIAEYQLNFDEPGRLKLKEVLNRLCGDITDVNVCDPEESEENESYNDVFYSFRNKTNLSNIWFAQSYYSTPIIRSVDDLVPTMIRILKNITKDNDTFTTQMLEIMSDLRGPVIKDVEGEGELITIGEEFKRQIKKCQDKITEVTDKKNQIKKTKQATTSEDKEIEMLNQRKLVFESDLADTMKKIHLINLRALNICNALLTYCKPKDLKHGIENLLLTLIFPMIKEHNEELESYGFLCLGLVCSIFKNYCLNFFQAFVKQAEFKEYESRNQASPKLIISLKCLFDFYLVYNLTGKGCISPSKFDTGDDEAADPQSVIENLVVYLFKSENLVKTLCIEGFCKLLLHNRISNPVPFLTYLLILWHDSLLPQNEGYEAIQILTAFFKRYTALSLENSEKYEQSLEIFLNILFTVEKEDMEFDNRYVYYHKSSLYSIIKSSLTLLSYSFNKENPNIKEFFQSNQIIGPQERFFLFLCNSLRYYQQELLPFYDKLLDRFDFVGEMRLRRETFQVMCQELERVEGFLDENKQKKQTSNIQKFLEKLKNVVEKINENFGELSADDRALCRNTSENISSFIKDTKSESSTFMKNLELYQLLIKKTGTVPEGLDNSMAGEFSAMSGSSLLQQKERSGRGGVRKKKAKKVEEQDDLNENNTEGVEEEEDDQENEETIEKNKRKKKKAAKAKAPKNKKKRPVNPQISILNQEVNLHEVENLENEEVDNENTNQVLNKRPRNTPQKQTYTPKKDNKKKSASKVANSPAIKLTGRRIIKKKRSVNKEKERNEDEGEGEGEGEVSQVEEIDDDIEEIDSREDKWASTKEEEEDDIEEVEEVVRTSSGRHIKKPKK